MALAIYSNKNGKRTGPSSCTTTQCSRIHFQDLLSRLHLKENFIHQLHKIVPNEFNLLLPVIRVFDLVCQNLTSSPLFSEMFLRYGRGGRQSCRKTDLLSQSDTASTVCLSQTQQDPDLPARCYVASADLVVSNFSWQGMDLMS